MAGMPEMDERPHVSLTKPQDTASFTQECTTFTKLHQHARIRFCLRKPFAEFSHHAIERRDNSLSAERKRRERCSSSPRCVVTADEAGLRSG